MQQGERLRTPLHPPTHTIIKTVSTNPLPTVPSNPSSLASKTTDRKAGAGQPSGKKTVGLLNQFTTRYAPLASTRDHTMLPHVDQYISSALYTTYTTTVIFHYMTSTHLIDNINHRDSPSLLHFARTLNHHGLQIHVQKRTVDLDRLRMLYKRQRSGRKVTSL